MKKVYFIRHAKSSWKSMDTKDIDRPLNNRGKKDAPFMANFLKKKILKIDGIIKSPAQRIKETVHFFEEAFELDNARVITEADIYEGNIYNILDAVQSAPPDWDTLLLFGHNPGMTYIALHFGGDKIDNVPTCGIIEVTSNVKNWEDFGKSNSKLTGFYYPKQHNIEY